MIPINICGELLSNVFNSICRRGFRADDRVNQLSSQQPDAEKNGRVAFFCGFFVAISVNNTVLGCNSFRGCSFPAVWYRLVFHERGCRKTSGITN